MPGDSHAQPRDGRHRNTDERGVDAHAAWAREAALTTTRFIQFILTYFDGFFSNAGAQSGQQKP